MTNLIEYQQADQASARGVMDAMNQTPGTLINQVGANIDDGRVTRNDRRDPARDHNQALDRLDTTQQEVSTEADQRSPPTIHTGPASPGLNNRIAT